jgi:hypothetical protein
MIQRSETARVCAVVMVDLLVAALNDMGFFPL